MFTSRKLTSARRVTRCCRTGNPPFEVAPGQRKTHVNSYRRQTVHRGKVYPGVSELPWAMSCSGLRYIKAWVSNAAWKWVGKLQTFVLDLYLSFYYNENLGKDTIWLTNTKKSQKTFDMLIRFNLHMRNVNLLRTLLWSWFCKPIFLCFKHVSLGP